MIEIFTDGACLGNPGVGGVGYLVRKNNQETTFQQGYFLTTNNRMELLAVILALKSLMEEDKNDNITVTTDSIYVKNGITSWIKKWKSNNWKSSTGKVKNQDLWKELDKLNSQYNIDWQWTKGHAGHRENEICDKLSTSICKTPTLSDVVYELENKQ